jgi:uncharacterized DUF497 family protein
MPAGSFGPFEWDEDKNRINLEKHGISFEESQAAFLDPNRVVLRDVNHSTGEEQRFQCIGDVGGGILTVRYTHRNGLIRIIGAGFWRKEKRVYEKENG